MIPSAGRLLLVIPSATSFRTFLTEVAVEWRRRGGVMAVATGADLPGHGDSDWPEGVERMEMPGTRRGSPVSLIRAALALRRYVRQWRPDIVHAHFAASALVAAAARTITPEASCAWLATFHGMHLAVTSSLRSRIVASVERWSARRMTMVCVLNREDREALAGLLPSTRIHLHPGYGVGCDLDVFDSGRFSQGERRRLREQAGIPAGAFVAAYVGRQVAFKGYHVAVRGFLEAEAAGLDGWLVLVGAADEAHESGLTAAERDAVARHPRIVRAGWQRDVAPYLAAADVAVLPSIREGMPVSAMESLALGTPVITVDARGCRDVVRDRVDGLVLPEPSPALVARALVACRADRVMLQGLSAAAIAGRGRFDRHRFAAAEADLYSGRIATITPLDG
jgi:glycosyltransferase involved in cell wall biosynthesis